VPEFDPASAIVKCQLALVCRALRSCWQTASQLPCLGGVVPFEAVDQPAGFGDREGFIKRSLAVDLRLSWTKTMVLALAKWISASSFKT